MNRIDGRNDEEEDESNQVQNAYIYIMTKDKMRVQAESSILLQYLDYI